jgi:sphingomyelin phosphodiesterase
LSDIWTKNDWLPASTENTVKFGGFYTTLVRPGFRIITLNNNLCYGHNWWILFDNGYMQDQLQWFQDTLHAAESANEIVHLLAHVPANDPLCYKPWSRVYRKIIERYARTIKAQFNGHSHVDEFNLYYSKTPGDSPPVSVAWNGGSLTTFSELNPNYRVYEVDNDSLEVLDHETWIYNLTEANQEPWHNPRWYKEYSFKEFYGLPNLKLDTLHGLIKGFGSNESRIHDYWRLKVKHADPQLKTGVTLQKLREHFCDIVTVEEGDSAKCDELWRL